MWGRPDPRDADFLVSAMSTEVRDDSLPHVSFVDLRRIEAIDPEAFAAFLSFMRQNAARFSRTVVRSATVHSGGLVGAAAAGYHRLLGEPFPSAVFSDVSPALAWLACDDANAAAVADLAGAARAIERTPTAVAALRRLLREDPTRTSLDRCASAIALSPRALQRALLAASTSFRAELQHARVDRAKELLRSTDSKMLAIALDLGFEKVQSFTADFRRATGETPAKWRARHRAGVSAGGK